MQDNTDRNRTSPFAFTGNKFEIRAVGSKQNVSFPMTVVAATLSEEIREVSEKLQQGMDVWEVIKAMIAETKTVRFEGNGYSQEWAVEAQKRGLPNLKTAKESYEQILSASVLREAGVFSDRELEARYVILSKAYCNCLITEAETMTIILNQYFVPRTMDYIERINRISNGKAGQKQLEKFENYYEKLLTFADEI